ncbi:GAF sensor signal transduction histidine kinase [Natronococcus amylolyticus DSM 10524]|uniref:histidine kinase n=2 Tax=Natronococcus amylolyticus TaxID=44470 RepID=L9XFM4_9EURY|nr:GAF sensor signal transduction histidine kinase [Natronococcus amylolyticus DSM 10524]
MFLPDTDRDRRKRVPSGISIALSQRRPVEPPIDTAVVRIMIHSPNHADDLGLEDGLEALRAGSEFSGPIDPADEHDSYDHLALVHESSTEQLSTVIPFVERGLERGERCVYVADETEPTTVLDGLRNAGVDVDAALDSGALAVHTAADSFLRNGSFDPDDAIAVLEDAIANATEEYDGFRIVSEMSWALRDASVEALVEYESKLNRLLLDDNGIALCQYDRERFPPSVLREVIETHPHLIYDGTVCQNFYYTPPAEVFGPDEPERELDRMMGTLVDRTEARAELRKRRRFLERQNEITADPDASFGEQLQRLFDLGCEWFDLELGAMARVDAERDRFEVEYTSDDHEYLEPGVELPLSETFCAGTVGLEPSECVDDPESDGYGDALVYEEFGLQSYLGTYVETDAGADRTFFFVSSDRRADGFTDEEEAFTRLMGQWVEGQLEQLQREEYERALYEIAADPDEPFDEKLQRVFDLGCERFDLELGGVARIDLSTDTFEVEAASGDHERLDPGTQTPLSETYCRLAANGERTAEVTDPERAGFEDSLAYRELGFESYLGTRIELENGPDRTFFFVSSESRDRPFSDAERTFHHLMAQWVAYELEYEERERALQASNERLEQFAYAASHDLQEPLRMITSYLQLLDRRYGDDLDEDAKEFLAYAVDGADRMRDMIEGLLAYSRVEAQGDPLEPTDLNVVLDDVREDLQLAIRESDAEITVGELPRVDGDPSQLRQVFQNLLDNAITYSGDDSPRIHVDARRRGERWVVSVHDEGIGIESENSERVFSVFDRLHSHEQYEGTGIGLALCERIAERHGGEIWVDSAPGEGATFSLALPAVGESTPPSR